MSSNPQGMKNLKLTMKKRKKHAQFQTRTNKYSSTSFQNLPVETEPYQVYFRNHKKLRKNRPERAKEPSLNDAKNILAWELQDLLNRVVKKSYEMDDVFHLETCRALVALSDEDKSGRLNFDEFKQIWLGVRSWIETFLKFDQGTFIFARPFTFISLERLFLRTNKMNTEKIYQKVSAHLNFALHWQSVVIGYRHSC